MGEKKKMQGFLLLAALTAVTGVVLFRGQSVNLLWSSLKQVRIRFLLAGLALMLGYVGCEALCTRQILRRLGHEVPYRYCLGYSLVGFYVSSVTPSATGGQPAQIYYMSRDGIPAAHGALNMMLIASCYQTAALLWGGAVWFFFPAVHGQMGGGLGLLLLYGACVMSLLTAGMLTAMFFPGLARRICSGALSLLEKGHVLRDPASVREKLQYQLVEYAEGADCVRRNPGLALRVLALCLLQQGLLFSVPWTVYLAFGLKGCGWIQVAGIQALLTLAVCNLPLPGAVGAAEGGFLSAFASVFGADLVTCATLVSRGISFYAFLLISFIAAAAVHLRTSRRARERTLREMTAEQAGGRVKAVREYLRTRTQCKNYQ